LAAENLELKQYQAYNQLGDQPATAADLAELKSEAIVANPINRIEVGLDYQIHIDLSIDLEHFGIQLDFCTHGEMVTA